MIHSRADCGEGLSGGLTGALYRVSGPGTENVELFSLTSVFRRGPPLARRLKHVVRRHFPNPELRANCLP
jgi:hypothetical protein